jgi:hypothetical protein
MQFFVEQPKLTSIHSLVLELKRQGAARQASPSAIRTIGSLASMAAMGGG